MIICICLHTHTLTLTAKLVVTTLRCSTPTSGPVVIETINGGLCDSGLTFAFVEEEAPSSSGKESLLTKWKPKQHGKKRCRGCVYLGMEYIVSAIIRIKKYECERHHRYCI